MIDTMEFKKDFLESIKTAAAVTGEGSCAAFVDNMSQYLIDSEVLSDFTPSFYTGLGGRTGRAKYRVDGYVYDEFDNTMNLVIADFDGNDTERKLTNSNAKVAFRQLRLFLQTALRTDLYRENIYFIIPRLYPSSLPSPQLSLLSSQRSAVSFLPGVHEYSSWQLLFLLFPSRDGKYVSPHFP